MSKALVTLEVFKNALVSIVDEMNIAMIRAAYSYIIKEAADCSTSLFDSHGRQIAQMGLPMHLGFLEPAVKGILHDYPIDTMEDGDVFIVNDPYRGASHLPDIIVAKPIFHGDSVIALSCDVAHHADVGGKTPGSLPPDATDIYQEGLRIPPLKIYEAGKVNKTLLEMIKLNVRIPESIAGDIDAQVAACALGGRRMLELTEKYGKDAVLQNIETLLNYSENRMRREIKDIPVKKCSSEGYLDSDGVEIDKPVKIKVSIEIQGTDIYFDFTGSSSQTKGPINAMPSTTEAAVLYVVKAITDPTIPHNEGCRRPVKTFAPEGTVVNPRSPAPVNARVITGMKIVNEVFKAFAKAIPERVMAGSFLGNAALVIGGTYRNKPYVFHQALPGGWGARPNKDGLGGRDVHLSNTMNTPAEAVETDYPLLVERMSLRRDSGGAGKYRGGPGVHYRIRVLADGELSLRSDTHLFPPFGLFGGKAGGAGSAFIETSTHKIRHLHSKARDFVKAGDTFVYLSSGGGGYGDPLDRDPEQVRNDVDNRRASLAHAREEYGVVVNPSTYKVELAATTTLRRRLRKRN